MKYFGIFIFSVFLISCVSKSRNCKSEVEKVIQYEQSLDLNSDIMFVFQHQDSVMFVKQKKPYEVLVFSYYPRKGEIALNNKTVIFAEPINSTKSIYKLFPSLKPSESNMYDDVVVYGYNSDFSNPDKILGSVYIASYQSGQKPFLRKVYEGNINRVFYTRKNYNKPKRYKIKEPKPS